LTLDDTLAVGQIGLEGNDGSEPLDAGNLESADVGVEVPHGAGRVNSSHVEASNDEARGAANVHDDKVERGVVVGQDDAFSLVEESDWKVDDSELMITEGDDQILVVLENDRHSIGGQVGEIVGESGGLRGLVVDEAPRLGQRCNDSAVVGIQRVDERRPDIIARRRDKVACRDMMMRGLRKIRLSMVAKAREQGQKTHQSKGCPSPR
jgi:hypothetical protein